MGGYCLKMCLCVKLTSGRIVLVSFINLTQLRITYNITEMKTGRNKLCLQSLGTAPGNVLLEIVHLENEQWLLLAKVYNCILSELLLLKICILTTFLLY